MHFKKIFKVVLALIIVAWFPYFNSRYALSGELGKPCPDPNLKYYTWDGEEYWSSFVDGYLFEIGRGEEYHCALYERQGIHERYSLNILISVKEFENRRAKEAGFLKGFKNILEALNPYEDIKIEDKRVWDRIIQTFSRNAVPTLEEFTGLKFEDTEDWFVWWEENKEKLVLSDDGERLVVREK